MLGISSSNAAILTIVNNCRCPMALLTGEQAALLEPVLFAVRTGSRRQIEEVLKDVRALLRQAQRQVGSQQPHRPSFDLGVASAYYDAVVTAHARSTLNDVISTIRATNAIDILRAIQETGEALPQNRLAERLGLDPGNLSRKLQKLEEASAIKLERMGRVSIPKLTELGIDALDGMHATSEHAEILARTSSVKDQPLDLQDFLKQLSKRHEVGGFFSPLASDRLSVFRHTPATPRTETVNVNL